MSIELESKIEGLLFYRGEEVQKKNYLVFLRWK